MNDCKHERLIISQGEGYYCSDCDKWFDVTAQETSSPKQECEHVWGDNMNADGTRFKGCFKCGKIVITPPALNATTCVKCGTEGPHTTTLENNSEDKDFWTHLNETMRRCHLSELTVPESEQWLNVTCRMCGHHFGTTPCKDAKEGM